MALLSIRFINSAGFVADAIDWSTNSLWDHTEIETEAGTWIGAHNDGGVQERAADYCTPTRERRYSIQVTDDQLSRITAFARSKVGTAYNFADIAGLFVHNRALTTAGRLICSMFVVEAAMAGGLDMLNVLPGYTQLITPETLHLSPLLIGTCTFSAPSPMR